MQHDASGRRFLMLDCVTGTVQLDGLEGVVKLLPSCYEIIDGLMAPTAIPVSLFPDDWSLLPYEVGAAGCFGSALGLEDAARECRYGQFTVSKEMWEQSEHLLRAVSNMRISDILLVEDTANIHFVSPDVPPVSDGNSTPNYLASYDADFNVISFTLARGQVLLDSSEES